MIRVNLCEFYSNLFLSGVTLFADLTVLRRREKKWLYMLSNWSYFMDNKFDIVKKRCQKGIPPSLRGRAWKYLSGATFHMEFSVNKTVFDVNVSVYLNNKP